MALERAPASQPPSVLLPGTRRHCLLAAGHKWTPSKRASQALTKRPDGGQGDKSAKVSVSSGPMLGPRQRVESVSGANSTCNFFTSSQSRAEESPFQGSRGLSGFFRAQINLAAGWLKWTMLARRKSLSTTGCYMSASENGGAKSYRAKAGSSVALHRADPFVALAVIYFIFRHKSHTPLPPVRETRTFPPPASLALFSQLANALPLSLFLHCLSPLFVPSNLSRARRCKRALSATLAHTTRRRNPLTLATFCLLRHAGCWCRA